MYLVAPLVITLGLSFVLYREKGKWNPVDLWPLDDYKMLDEIKLRLSNPQGKEASLQEGRARGGVSGWKESAYTLFQEKRQKEIREFEAQQETTTASEAPSR